MRSFRLLALALFVIVVAPAVSAQQRSVGQVIDDTTITTEIKAKLTADALSNLTKNRRQAPRPSRRGVSALPSVLRLSIGPAALRARADSSAGRAQPLQG